jgi:Xaa-Pro aminopeptidase
MLTHYRYTVAPPFIDTMLSVKNKREIDGLRRAYLRDGASFVRYILWLAALTLTIDDLQVRFLAWLETKLAEGYDITEYEAASRLTEFRRHNKHFMGLAYKSISATGANAALPHYTPKKSTAHMIERDTPYLK